MDLVHNENIFVVDAFVTLVWCFKQGSLEPLKPFLEAMFKNTLFERLQNQNRSSVFKSKVKITQINLLRMLSNHSSLYTSYWLSTLSWFPYCDETMGPYYTVKENNQNSKLTKFNNLSVDWKGENSKQDGYK